MKEETHQDQ